MSETHNVIVAWLWETSGASPSALPPLDGTTAQMMGASFRQALKSPKLD